MAVIIGSARIDENGSINGRKGDQTGREVAEEEYYRHKYDWDAMRCIDPNRALMMSYDMASMCNNPNYGYSQSDRYSGLYEAKKVGYDTAKVDTPCNIDCSSGVRTCLAYAGYDVGDFYTGNEYDVIMSTGAFEDVTDQFDHDTGEGLYSGDILVSKKKGHTVIVTQGKDPRPIPVPEPTPTIEPCPVHEWEEAVYRMYNPDHEEHFFTASYEEAVVLLGMGWKPEGVAFITPKESEIPVFRMYADKHIFITDIQELHSLVEHKWQFEGIAFHASDSLGIKVYRFYNPNNGDHLYTASEEEKNSLVAAGWSDEDVAFLALRQE